MNKQWKIEEINWKNVNEVQNGDTVQTKEKIVRVLHRHHSTETVATIGEVWGINLLVISQEKYYGIILVADGLEEPLFTEG